MVLKSLIVNTGDQPEVQQVIDNFFQGCKKELEARGYDSRRFNIRSGEIAYDQINISDDRVTQLLYEDRVVGIVLETRTLGNRVRYDFFRNESEI